MTNADVTTPPVTARRSVDWRTVLGAWAASRALVVVTVAVANSSVSRGLASWDSSYYLGIAMGGYGAPPVEGMQTNWPFFPLLPLLIRAMTEVGLPARGSLLVLNALVFLLALAGVERVARRHLGASGARWAVWALAMFPMTVVFSMGYPSSIFLAASVWAFVWVDESRDAPAALAVVVATLVRPNGVVVAVVLGGWLLVRGSPGRAAVVALPGMAALAAWLAVQWHWAGDPFAFWAAKSAWEEITIAELVTDPRLGAASHFGLALAATGALVCARRRLPWHWLAFAALSLGPPLVVGVMGLGRYSNECFPVFVAAGAIIERAPLPVRWLVVALGACGVVAFGVMVTRYELVP